MKRKILVVDDEPDILSVVIFRLKKMGYDVLVAVNGQEAIEKLDEYQPDLIVMDIAMPVMDGLEATRNIKADAKHCNIPILILTASRMTENLEDRVRAVGADGLLTKPFEIYELIAYIEKLFPSQ